MALLCAAGVSAEEVARSRAPRCSLAGTSRRCRSRGTQKEKICPRWSTRPPAAPPAGALPDPGNHAMPIHRQPIRILKPSLDDFGKQTVLRGIIDNDSLSGLLTDYYQRELLPDSNRRDIIEALEKEVQLPDIELGMRGQTFTMPTPILVTLEDPTYIIDGLQRVG